jgi:hypothetical protein
MLIDRLRKFDGRLLGFVGDVAGLRVEIFANRFRMLPSRSYNEHGVVPALKPLLLSRGKTGHAIKLTVRKSMRGG